MRLLFGSVIVFLSLYGYIQFLSKKIRAEFALAVTFAAIGNIMFFAGILNIMPLAAYTTAIGGIVLSVYSLKDIKNSISRIITPGTVFFAVLSAAIAFIVKGSLFHGGDAYHHWGVVARLLIKYNRFPTPENFNISFPTYPTGSASFIYYFAQICNADSEWFIILVQTVLTLAMFITIFAFAKGALENIFTSAAVIMLLCTNEPFQFIVVDNLLAAVTIAGISIAIYYRDCLEDKLFYIVPFTVFLTSVKNSGVLFAFFIALYFFIYIPKNKPNLIRSAGLFASSFITLMLWQKHVDLLFPKKLSDSLHAMSREHYKSMYKEKVELDIVGRIWDMYSKQFFTLKNLILFIAVAAVLCIFFSIVVNKRINRDFIHLSVFSALLYIVYQVGLFGTYVFSIPVAELVSAESLPSYNRYHLTIIAIVAALVYIGALHYLRDTSGKHRKFSYPVFILTILLFINAGCTPHFSYFRPMPEGDLSEFISYRNLLNEYGVPHRCSYLVIDSNLFLYYYTGYLLDPTDAKAWDVATLQKYERYINNFDYLILVDDSPETMEYISQLLGAEITERVVNLPSYIDQVYVYD